MSLPFVAYRIHLAYTLTKVIILGAGIAGLSTAYALARRKQPASSDAEILLIERNDAPGLHSSGRNAAIMRTAIPDAHLHALARASAKFYSDPPFGFANGPLVLPVGIYLATPEGQEQALQWANHPDTGQAVQVDVEQLYRQVPALSSKVGAVYHQPEEGVFYLDRILQGFVDSLQNTGVKLVFDQHVESLWMENRKLKGIRTAKGLLEADTVVVATGGWAASLPADAGYSMPLIPYRRHLLVTEPLADVQADAPIVWITEDEFYFRPENGGYMVCACDSDAVLPHQGEVTDPEAEAQIRHKMRRWLAPYADARTASIWSGMRTFASDHRFVIGPDPRLEGLHWVAGLGGHGMTCGPAIGELAADWICGEPPQSSVAHALRPHRLLLGRNSESHAT